MTKCLHIKHLVDKEKEHWGEEEKRYRDIDSEFLSSPQQQLDPTTFITPSPLPGLSSEKLTTSTSAPTIIRKLDYSNEVLNIEATEL